MGIDYYVCSVCEEPFPDCNDHDWCEGCGEKWCESCMDEFKTFIYQGKQRCDLCFETEPPEPSDSDIVDYLLKRVKAKKEDILQEMKKLPEFSKPKDTYKCTEKSEHECNGACKTLNVNFEDEERKEKMDEENYIEISDFRGLCCKVKFKEDYQKGEWCQECLKPQAKRSKKL